MGVTVSQVQALKTQYPTLYSQVKSKVITSIQFSSTGVTVGYMEKEQYRQATAQKQTAPTTSAAPLPTPYWQGNKQMVGSQPYVSGYTSTPTPPPAPAPVPTPTKAPIKKQKKQPIPKKLTDPISKQVFKNIGETQKFQDDPIGYTAKKAITYTAVATGLAAPAVALKGATIGIGLTQGIVGVTEQRVLTPEEMLEASLAGAALSGVGTAVFNVTGVGGMAGVKGVAARAGVSAGIAGGAGYVVSGGKPEAAMYGAAFGAGFSLAGEALSYAYPRYIKPAAAKAYERLFPERSMYKRVISSQQPSQTLAERIIGKLSPERAMYKRVTSPPKNVIQAKNVYGSGVTYKSPSGFAQQTLLVRQTTQKVSMKPFYSTLQLQKGAGATAAYALTRTAIPKTKTKTATKTVTRRQATKQVTQLIQQRELIQTVQQQLANPFLRYQGKPYFRQQQREREEYVYLVYPATSPLEAPRIIQKPTVTPRQFHRQYQSPLTRRILKQAPTTALDPLQDESQAVQQAVDQEQIQRQIQEQVQQLTQQEKGEQHPHWVISGFDMPSGFARMNREVFTGYGKYKRKYPIMTGKQMLEEVFG